MFSLLLRQRTKVELHEGNVGVSLAGREVLKLRTFATIIDHEVSSLAISSYIPAMIVSLAGREVLKLRFSRHGSSTPGTKKTEHVHFLKGLFNMLDQSA
ncbi:hypothetical protein Tco_0336511 [Tanacetum coccineum]